MQEDWLEPDAVMVKNIREVYSGYNMKYRRSVITSTYFERHYAFGLATDKIPARYYEMDGFPLMFGELLGMAAAPNITGKVL